MNSTLVSTLNSAFAAGGDSVTSIATTFVPIIIGIAMVGLGITLGPKFIKKLSRSI